MANTASRLPDTATSKAGVAGLFRSETEAEKALDELKSSGFSDTEIGVATAHEEGKTGSFWAAVTSKFGKHGHTEQATDLHNSLIDSGVPDQQARYFNAALGRGGVLVTVHCGPQRSAQAVSILLKNGADVGSEASAASSPGAASDRDIGYGERIQLVGEIFRVHKERVSRGEVRLRKEVVSEKQTLEVPITREELVVERIPGEGREATGADLASGQKEIRVPLSEERVTVEKKPVVNEEVRVGKRQVQDTKHISDTVRHEELRTDAEGDVDDSTARSLKDKDKEKTRRSA